MLASFVKKFRHSWHATIFLVMSQILPSHCTWWPVMAVNYDYLCFCQIPPVGGNQVFSKYSLHHHMKEMAAISTEWWLTSKCNAWWCESLSLDLEDHSDVFYGSLASFLHVWALNPSLHSLMVFRTRSRRSISELDLYSTSQTSRGLRDKVWKCEGDIDQEELD